MAESRAGKGYRSPLNLRLPQMPQVADDVMFSELLSLYNACHALNAYLDQIRLILEGGKSDDPPSESLRFTRSFWIEAATSISAGSVISLANGKAHLGADRVRGLYNKFTGIALNDVEAGENVRFGVGPGIVEVPGFYANQNVWATLRGEPGAGQFYNERPEVEEGDDPESVVIGFCIQDRFILIIPNYVY